MRVSALASASVAAGCAAYASNERVVSHRAARLERLRAPCGHCDMPRTSKSDAHALANFRRPIIVENLLDEWPASNTRRWSFSALRSRIGHALVDCGSSTGGVPFYLVAANAERSAGRADLALYVFASDFSDDSGKAQLLRDVSGLPSLTTGDVFNAGAAADDRDRPVWRWLLAGPAGSGTCMHQDPWSYSSWNASLVGSKRWVLFPPEVSRETLHPPRTDLLGRAAAFVGIALPRRAAAFMDEILPALRGCGHGEVELVQRPGETVAFPADWHHCVVNLDATLAVTESYGRASDLDAIVEKLRGGGRARFAEVVEREAAR